MRAVRELSAAFAATLVVAAVGCTRGAAERDVLVQYPIDGPTAIVAPTGVTFDPDDSADGNGSLQIVALATGTFPLIEVPTLQIEHADLIYQAALRTESLEGRAYLKMVCQLSNGEQGTANGMDAALSETTEWRTVETHLEIGFAMTPRSCLLGVVVEGRGTVWLDDVALLRGPLP